ncbi:glycosyltransferase [Isobaculum melis]|uniref:UDP:flavonoid glycosyltransferase YjiC, YdhE family n=1 Tax=Isobaculum melis TaxID=142588 RepID=A0A1H9RKC4_9LACT|nr:nucleotide disphospho-sugar-binding domain-containing protein [Isobaculum melis]SER73210.1 UDP:flavonoid glycosyltransferase YjiC, YdhE family [Isobaculum melis]
MRTFLFAPETFNLAETTRMIEVAKACKEDATCIFMGYSQKFAYLIETAGFEFYYLTPHLTEQDVTNIMKFDQMKTIRMPFSYEMLMERTQQELQLIGKIQPDCILIGSTISLFISARVKKIPLVYVKPYAYTRANIESVHFMKASNKYIKEIMRAFFLQLKWFPRNLKKVIKYYHLEADFNYTIDFFDADLNCITTPEVLTKESNLPLGSVYVGPIFAHLNEAIPFTLKKLLKESTVPTIFCSMGSSGNAKVILSLLHQFKDLPVKVISPMKSFLADKEIEELPENVYIYDWLPALKVQKMVTASVLHGGEGTIQTACVAGKPFIGIGLQKEQEYNIAACVAYGNAVQIKKSKLRDYEYFKRMLHQLLNEQHYQQRATLLQQELSLINGCKNVRDAVMYLLEKE